MIIKYLWRTSRYSKRSREFKERAWKGWFLFGIIPIYIENTQLIIK